MKSPIDGTVISRPVEVGQVISSPTSAFGEGSIIMTMAALSKVRVRALVDEIDVGKVKIGQKVSIKVAAYRDKAMIELMYSSGLRLSEITSLNITSINFSDRTLSVVGKGNKQRYLPIGSQAIKALRKWIDNRESKTKDEALFLNKFGKRLSGQRTWLIQFTYRSRKASLSVIDYVLRDLAMEEKRPMTLIRNEDLSLIHI